jgi:LysR family transcriptional regulator, glycine cleavage system transcriptional activator
VIQDENTMLSWNRWFAAAGVEPVTPLPGATFTDPVLCLEAVIGGQGVMLAWQLLAADALADGRLVAPFGVTVASGLGYYLVTRASGRQSAKAAEFSRWITREVKATMAGFGSQR